jgi:hypothetical protein
MLDTKPVVLQAGREGDGSMPPVAPSYAISGARGGLTRVQEEIITEVIDALPSGCIVITGACVGVDAYAARYAKRTKHGVFAIVPADRSRVDLEWIKWCDMYHQMARGSTYADRNAMLVSEATGGLRAFPSAPEHAPESRRSGTWQTIRMAYRHGERLQEQSARHPHPYSVIITIIGRTIR